MENNETQAERNARRVAELRAAGCYSTLGQGLGPSESQPPAEREQAAQGAVIRRRLVPAPDHGRGFRRDPETGFVFYSSEWLSDEREADDAS